MAGLVDAGFTAAWSTTARVAWGTGLMCAVLFAVYAFVRSERIWKGEPDVRDPVLLELPSGTVPATLWQRARSGVLIVLMLGGWAVLGVLVSGVHTGEPMRALLLGAGWCLLLALSGAAGGMTYHATDRMRRRGGLGRTVANVASILAYCAAAAALLGLVALFIGEGL